jgi:hypothetical protein
MKSTRTTIAWGLRVGTVLGLLASAAEPAAASPTGSTDIWRNEFTTSFGAPAQTRLASAKSLQAIASTDIYANQFQRSFGQAEPARSEGSFACGQWSTDVWGNGFEQSFGSARSPVGAANATACAGTRTRAL